MTNLRLAAVLITASVAPQAALAQTPPPALHEYLLARLKPDPAEPPVRYSFALVDLDGDRREEAVVRVEGSATCGSGGCNLLVLTPAGNSYREVSRHTIIWPPIGVLPARTRGWHDLSVFVAGGGIRPGYHARLRFDGRHYPLNPSVPPAEPMAEAEGRILIGRGAPTFALLR